RRTDRRVARIASPGRRHRTVAGGHQKGDVMPAEERYAVDAPKTRGALETSIDEPIRAGSLLWVFTDPHRGHELAYNRWYERDHYYGGCMIGPYHFAGSRWV